VEQSIINNNALSSEQKDAAYQDMCLYKMNDTQPFSSKTCRGCKWDGQDVSCLPCSDAVPVATNINSWKKGTNYPDNPFNGYNIGFKVVAMGVGNALSDELGSRQLKGMNYDPARTMNVPWNDLTKTMSEIVDQSCNQVNTGV